MPVQLNERQREMIRGMTGNSSDLTVHPNQPQPSSPIDQELSNRLYQQAMQNYLNRSAQAQGAQHPVQQEIEQHIQNIDPELINNPPPRFQELKKKVEAQQPISALDIRNTISPTVPVTPEQEAAVNASYQEPETEEISRND